MFQLFRRHQKVLLTSIAVLAIGSMAFSAIAPLFLDQNKESITKNKLNSDLQEGIVLLFNHSFDAASKELIFPEALFSQALLDTGVLEATYLQNKEKVALEINEVFEKMKGYEPCEITPGSSYFDLLGQLSPKLYDLIKKLKNGSSLSSDEKLKTLIAFFQEKNKFPLPLMLQYIQAVTKNKSSVTLEDLYFFGLKNPDEFFGTTLVSSSVKSLTSILKEEMKLQKPALIIEKNRELLSKFYGTNVHPNQFFVAIGITPECGIEALKLMAAIESIKKLSKEELLLDSASYKDFMEYAGQKIPVNCYEFNADLEPKTLEEAMYLEMYSNLKSPLEFDQYEIKVRFLEKTKAFQRLSKKQIYAEALKGYGELSELMPYALSSSLDSDKDKLEAIKSLTGSSKDLLEKHMQVSFAKKDPTFFKKILGELPMQTQVLYVAKEGTLSPLVGFSSLEQFKNELDMLPVNTPVFFDLADNYLYEIELTSSNKNQVGMTYSQALSSGILKEKLKVELEGTFKEILKKNPSKLLTAQKKLKTLDEAFQDLLDIKALGLKKELAQSMGVDENTMPQLLLKAYPKMILSRALKNKKSDFRLHSSEGWLTRSEAQGQELKKLFTSDKNHVSEVVLSNDGHYRFYEKTGPITTGEPILDKQALEYLAHEKFQHAFKEKLKK